MDCILTLKGQMSHRVELGKDARGNLTRIDNVLNAIPARLNSQKVYLENLYAQMEAAKTELGKPFPQEIPKLLPNPHVHPSCKSSTPRCRSRQI